MEISERNKVILSSLLHDIGKLGLRAGRRGSHEEIGKNFVMDFGEILPGIDSLISMHHNREDVFNKDGYLLLKKLIIGDWLASSERIGKDEGGEEIRTIGLDPIFSKISIYSDLDIEGIRDRFFYLGVPLKFKNGCEEIFPKLRERVSSDIEDNYKDNWSKFMDGFKKITEFQKNHKKLIEYIFSLYF
jgi:CRISPR/Cas system-associated protein Cas10 (large subunit of type III CRISPR-Cas system)